MKQNSGLKTFVVILLIVCLGLGGFIFYDKVINKDNNCPEETKNVTNKDNSNVVVTSQTKTTQILISKPGKIIVDKNGDAYLVFDENYTHYNKIKNANGLDKLGKYGEYEVDDYVTGLDYDENSKKTIKEHKFNGYKLNISNIISVYEVEIGQDPTSYPTYLFIEEDGTVDMLAFEIGSSAKAILEKNVSEHANIVSVNQSATFDSAIARLVDKDGNTYDFENYKYFQ